MAGCAQRYAELTSAIAACAEACGRSADAVKLICVSKQAPLEDVLVAFEAGASAFGENRIEVMEPKAVALPDAQWHFIGNIQTRKIPAIVQYARLIHSVWRDSQLQGIERAAAKLDKVQDILIEVNVSGESSKDGLAPAEVAAFLAAAEELPHVRVCGLMTMAPQGDPVAAKAAFEGLAQLRRELIELRPQRAETLTELSMGMSEDWEAAVAAGSTMVRIGRAVFSPDFA